MPAWRTTKRAPPGLVVLATVIFFAMDFDSLNAGIEWIGYGKWMNFGFRYTAIICTVLFLLGCYQEKWAKLMKPILYVLIFGIFLALIIALSYFLGLDVTGSTSEHTSSDSISDEKTTTSTTMLPNTELSTTNSTSNMQDTPGKKFSSVYAFCFFRAFFCLVIWVFHYFTYTDKMNERN